MRIFINPGHCIGVDPGAISPALGITEAEVVRDVGEMVKNYLENVGYEVILMQSNNLAGEDGPYKYSVCAKSNCTDCEVFVSLHCNAAGNPNAQGTECFYYPGSRNGKLLSKCIQNQLVGELDTYDRGIKEANFIVLKNTNAVATLVEIAFISNPEEALMLADPSRQDDIASAIARGITDFLNEV